MTLPRTPAIVNAEFLASPCTKVLVPSPSPWVQPQWVPARPHSYPGFNLVSRIKLAYAVFTGRYDALDWGRGDTDRNGQWTHLP